MSGNPFEFRLPSDCTVASLAELRRELLIKMKVGGDIVFDAGGLATIDTAGLQMFLAVKKELTREGWKLQWADIPEVLTRKAELGGFGSLLDSK